MRLSSIAESPSSVAGSVRESMNGAGSKSLPPWVVSRSTAKCRKGVLPALSVMNKLHQRPYDATRLYNVELMGYDNCYENLDLTVDRRFLVKDALRVLMQALFLPFFVLFPPIWWMQIIKKFCCKYCKCCSDSFEIEPRYRPVGHFVSDFEV